MVLFRGFGIEITFPSFPKDVYDPWFAVHDLWPWGEFAHLVRDILLNIAFRRFLVHPLFSLFNSSFLSFFAVADIY